jgi:hypothetical protein
MAGLGLRLCRGGLPPPQTAPAPYGYAPRERSVPVGGRGPYGYYGLAGGGMGMAPGGAPGPSPYLSSGQVRPGERRRGWRRCSLCCERCCLRCSLHGGGAAGALGACSACSCVGTA